ncbi:hypothetical protein [Natrinema gelatinilyticum]
MDIRRAALIAALVCALVGSTAIFLVVTVTDESSTTEPAPT